MAEEGDVAISRMPKGLREILDRSAKENSRTRSGQITHYVKEGLARDGLLPPKSSDSNK